MIIITMPERRAHNERLIRTLGVESRATILDAVLSSSITFDMMAEMRRNGQISERAWAASASWKTPWFNRLSQGRVACALSHIKAQKYFLTKTQYRAALFLEDDLDIDSIASIAAQERLFHTLLRSPLGWDVIWLGYCHERCDDSVRFFDQGQGVMLRSTLKPLCTHGFAVSRAGSTTLVRHSNPLQSTIDGMWAALADWGRTSNGVRALNSFILVPAQLHQARERFVTMTHSQGDILKAGVSTQEIKRPLPFWASSCTPGGWPRWRARKDTSAVTIAASKGSGSTGGQPTNASTNVASNVARGASRSGIRNLTDARTATMARETLHRGGGGGRGVGGKGANTRGAEKRAAAERAAAEKVAAERAAVERGGGGERHRHRKVSVQDVYSEWKPDQDLQDRSLKSLS